MPEASFKHSKLGKLLIIPLVVTIFCAYVLVNSYLTTGDWFLRSVELKGGSLVTVIVNNDVSAPNIQSELSKSIDKVSVSEVRGIKGKELSIETEFEKSSLVLSELKRLGISTEKSSVRTVGSGLGSAFWQQVQIGILAAFVLMGLVVFAMFKSFVPSMAVILAAALDIFMTLGFMQIFGIELSLSSFAALLMLIGYSVDTDILQTSRVTKRVTEQVNERFVGAFKTGMTMTLTTITALIIMIVTAISPVLTQIASVLLIGLILDMMNTWITNAAILKWWVMKKGGFGQ